MSVKSLMNNQHDPIPFKCGYQGRTYGILFWLADRCRKYGKLGEVRGGPDDEG